MYISVYMYICTWVYAVSTILIYSFYHLHTSFIIINRSVATVQPNQMFLYTRRTSFISRLVLVIVHLYGKTSMCICIRETILCRWSFPLLFWAWIIHIHLNYFLSYYIINIMACSNSVYGAILWYNSYCFNAQLLTLND